MEEREGRVEGNEREYAQDDIAPISQMPAARHAHASVPVSRAPRTSDTTTKTTLAEREEQEAVEHDAHVAHVCLLVRGVHGRAIRPRRSANDPRSKTSAFTVWSDASNAA